MTSDKKQQFNVYLSPSTVRRIKHAAVDANVSLSALVEQVLSDYLDDKVPAADNEIPPAQHAPLQLMLIRYVTHPTQLATFYEALGLNITRRGRSENWFELSFGDAVFALHAASAETNHPAVELSFVSTEPLEVVVERCKEHGLAIDDFIVDEAFGRSLIITDPEGLTLQINEHDPSLYADQIGNEGRT